MNKKLIVLVGPTGVGKTELSLSIAEKFKTPIISSDSRQIYKETVIGTAAPTKEMLEKVKHYFIGKLSIEDYYNVSMFEFDVLDVVEEIHKTNDYAFMTGGSCMYVDAVCKGIDDMPTIDMKIRNELLERKEKEGIDTLRFELKKLDPDFYYETDIKNPKRILKALEVCYQTGKPYSSFRKKTAKQRPFDIIKIGINRDRQELYNRINLRVDQMIEEGLLGEVKSLLPFRHLNSMNTVGYKEFFPYYDGEYPLETAIELVKRNSRRYAKRQLSWFNRDKDIKWFHPDNIDEILGYIDIM